MKQPDFIIGGTTRSGVNTLLHVLDNHPQIFIPRIKAHRYFLQSKLIQNISPSCRWAFAEAARALDAKENQFLKNTVLFGEKQYDVELAATCPNTKVIFTLRNPTERAARMFYWARANKREPLRKFEDAIEAELQGKRSPDNPENSDLCWLYKNQYEHHIKEWVSRFPRKNLLFMIYEEWTNLQNANALKPLEDTLQLEANSLSKQYNENFSAKDWIKLLRDREPPKYKPLPERLRNQLEAVFACDKNYISELLGRDIPSWNPETSPN